MNRSKTVALSGLLIALAFGLSWIERVFPLTLPIPGFKLGLANVVTLFALYHLNARSAFLILAGRCALTAVLFGGPIQLAFALTGGIFALITMFLLKNRKSLSVFGVSIAGAAAHNIGQVTAAVVIMRTFGVYSYLLFLLPVAVPTGFLIGLIYKFCGRAWNQYEGAGHRRNG